MQAQCDAARKGQLPVLGGGGGWRGWAEEVECGRRGGRSSGGDLRGSRSGGGLDREIVVHEWCLGFRV